MTRITETRQPTVRSVPLRSSAKSSKLVLLGGYFIFALSWNDLMARRRLVLWFRNIYLPGLVPELFLFHQLNLWSIPLL
jgi:hypothetical protein